MAFLEIKNIDAFYGDVQVLFDLSLQVAEGEVVSIIGGNGAGSHGLGRSAHELAAGYFAVLRAMAKDILRSLHMLSSGIV